MDSINLKDFNPENQDIETEADTELSSSTYHQDINTLKIDKLSNRVTIISIIIPCIIGVILIFAYLDMKERMVDVDLTKKNQFEQMSMQVEEKLNALEIKIAKNQFDLENKLPELEKKNISFEGQIAKLSTLKADNKTIKKRFSKIEKRVSNNASQDKTTLMTIERINQETLASIKESQNEFNKITQQIKDDTNLFKEEFDSRLLELSDFELQLGELGKNNSLLDKKINSLQTLFNSHNNKINEQLKTLNQRLTTNISRLQNSIDQIARSQSKSQVKSNPNIKTTKPEPQINIDSSTQSGIKEESLTQ